MLAREKLVGLRRCALKLGHCPNRQTELSLIDSHLEALSKIEELESLLKED